MQDTNKSQIQITKPAAFVWILVIENCLVIVSWSLFLVCPPKAMVNGNLIEISKNFSRYLDFTDFF